MALIGNAAIFSTLFSILILTMTTMSVHQGESMNVSTSQTSSEEIVRPLPLRNHTWKTIRESNSLYIDKTPFLMKLLKAGPRCMIFTRPPGFGKTTFLEMMADYFRGKNDMFKGLAIEELGNTKYYAWNIRETGEPLPKWKEFPVIHLNFREIPTFNTEQEFDDHFQFLLKSIAKTYGVYDVDRKYKYFRFCSLIEELYRKFNKTLVFILVDEYDYPFQHAHTILNNTELATKIKFHLEHMMSVMKEDREQVGLALFAGVLKLNVVFFDRSGAETFNDNDLSFDKDLAEAFGFTENEIKNNLSPYLEKWARERCATMNAQSKSDDPESILNELKIRYGSYQFSEKCDASVVLNPLMTIESLRKQEFGDYYTSTDSLRFLVKQFYEMHNRWDLFKNYVLYFSCGIYYHDTNAWNNETPLNLWMLAHGYYTIFINYDRNSVVLRFPNKKIEDAMEYNLAMYLPEENKFIHEDYSKDLAEFRNALSTKDPGKAMRILSLFKFPSYAYTYDPWDWKERMNLRQIARRVEFFLRAASINYRECKKFNIDINSKANKENVYLQTTNLKMNYIFKIQITNNDTETALPIIVQLQGNLENNPKFFKHAPRNQTAFCFLGLNFVFHKGSEKLNSWIALPFENDVPQYSDVVTQPEDLKQKLLEKYSPYTVNSHP